MEHALHLEHYRPASGSAAGQRVLLASLHGYRFRDDAGIQGLGPKGEVVIEAPSGHRLYGELSQYTGKWVQVSLGEDQRPYNTQIIPGGLVARLRETLAMAESDRLNAERSEAIVGGGDGEDGHGPTDGGEI